MMTALQRITLWFKRNFSNQSASKYKVDENGRNDYQFKTRNDSLKARGLNDFDLVVEKNNLPVKLLNEVLGLNRNVNETGNRLQGQGWWDGATGLDRQTNKEQIQQKVNAITSHFVEPVKAMAYGISDGLVRLVSIKNEKLINLNDEFKRRQKVYELIDQKYLRNTSEFSLLIGLFYLLVSMLLIFADVPLAVELSSQGFEFVPAVDPNVPDTSINRLFYDAWAVLRSNWEVFILSVGIALCTIYVKIYYDNLLGRSVHNDIIFDKFFKKEYALEEEDQKKIERYEKIKGRVSLLLLIITVMTMIVLGVFRFETIENLTELEGAEVRQSTDSQPISYDELDLSRSWITKVAFILITVLFPLIGGVCASLGLTRVSGFMDRMSYRRRLKSSKKEVNAATEDLKEAEVELSKWKSHLFRFINKYEQNQWLINNQIISSQVSPLPDESALSKAEEQIGDYLMGCYLEGHNDGVINPRSQTEESDLFLKAQELRDRRLSLDFNKFLRSEK